MMQELTLYIDITNASGVRYGPGPITSASEWEYTARMDVAGDWRFTMPATDPMAEHVQKKRYVYAYARAANGGWMEVGAGIIDTIERVPQADGITLLTVSGMDLLRELSYRSVKDLKLSMSNTAITHASALSQIAAYAPAGWTFTPDASPPNNVVYGRYNGESVLAAVVKLAEKSQTHFYRSTGRTLVCASDFTASGIRAVQAGPGDLVAETCAIVDITETVDTYDLLTRIYPRGSGNADVQLTLKATTRTAPTGYSLDTVNNYLQNNAAIAQYGVIEEYVDWKEIGPVENTAPDIQAAANMLYDEALEELRRRSEDVEVPYYTLRLAECSTLLRPMQTIRVVYFDPDSDTNIDRTLNILEATWHADVSGVQTTSVTVSTADRRPQSESQAVADTLTQGRIYQALPQLNANSYVTSYTKNVDGDNDATFRFRLGNEVVSLQSVFFEFQLLPFESTVKAVGGLTSGSGDLKTTVPSVNASGAPSNNTSGAPSTNVSSAPSNNTSSTPSIDTSGVPDNNTSGTPSDNVSGGPSNNTSGGPEGAEIDGAGEHSHHFPITLGAGSVTYPVGYGAAGTSGGLVSTLGGSVHNYPTNSTADHTHDLSSHTHTLSGHTHTLANHTHSLGNHTHNLNSHTHDLNNHTHTLNNHTHDLNNHVHDLSDSLTAIYGIFRDADEAVYELNELEYSVNGGAWANVGDDATDLGDGWYRLDITDTLMDADTFHPLQEANYLSVRGAAEPPVPVGVWEILSGDLEIVLDVAALGVNVGDRVIISGTALGTGSSTNIDGEYTVAEIGLLSITVRTTLADDSNTVISQGNVGRVLMATIDAQLAVRNVIQSVALI